MAATLEALLQEQNLPYQKNIRMAQRTTLRVGGPAAWWLEAACAEDIVHALRAAQMSGVRCAVVGGGSNLLVADTGFDGLVICVGAGMAQIRREGNLLHAQAGARIAQVAQAAQAAGLAGLEGISGVPGTVGGALAMNAGAYGTEIGERVQSVQVLDEKGKLRRVDGVDMAFGYRESALQAHGWVAVEASLRLAASTPAAVAEAMRTFAGMRREKQPLQQPSAGSFFKRPKGHFAAALIEQAGLKGARVGGAQVSEKHAGFLVNVGGATAQDFFDLMEKIQNRVMQQSGIALEPEVKILR